MMVAIDLCGFCKHYKGLIDGWLPSCDAYPDGLPRGFESESDKKCSNEITFEVRADKKELYNEFFVK